MSSVIGIGFGQTSEMMRAPLHDFGLFDVLSAEERRLLTATRHTQHEIANAQWQVECRQAFAWCLGFVELNPIQGCDDSLASHFPSPFADPSEFIAELTLRPFDEIYQQADLHYRLHWAAVDARLNGRKTPLKESIVMERRKALDWVVGVEADWDQISLST